MIKAGHRNAGFAEEAPLQVGVSDCDLQNEKAPESGAESNKIDIVGMQSLKVRPTRVSFSDPIRNIRREVLLRLD